MSSECRQISMLLDVFSDLPKRATVAIDGLPYSSTKTWSYDFSNFSNKASSGERMRDLIKHKIEQAVLPPDPWQSSL